MAPFFLFAVVTRNRLRYLNVRFYVMKEQDEFSQEEVFIFLMN